MRPDLLPHLPKNGEKLTILIVEDEQLLREYVTNILKRYFHVCQAGDIAEADAIMAVEDVSIILSDHELPGGESGLEFLDRLRKSHPDIPRLLMTGHTQREVFLSAINGGEVLRFLVKPFELPQLLEACDLALVERERKLSSQKNATENKAMREKMRSIPYLGRRLASIAAATWVLLQTGLATLVIGSGVALALGCCVLLFLYTLKSTLGFDIFEHMHAHELFTTTGVE